MEWLFLSLCTSGSVNTLRVPSKQTQTHLSDRTSFCVYLGAKVGHLQPHFVWSFYLLAIIADLLLLIRAGKTLDLEAVLVLVDTTGVEVYLLSIFALIIL